MFEERLVRVARDDDPYARYRASPLQIRSVMHHLKQDRADARELFASQELHVGRRIVIAANGNDRSDGR